MCVTSYFYNINITEKNNNVLIYNLLNRMCSLWFVNNCNPMWKERKKKNLLIFLFFFLIIFPAIGKKIS